MFTSTLIAAYISTMLAGQPCGNTSVVREMLTELGKPIYKEASVERERFMLGWPDGENLRQYLFVSAKQHDGFVTCESQIVHYDIDGNLVNPDGSLK